MLKESYPLIVIAIEGPDGAGKTTLINQLKRQYPNISLLKSSDIGLMPKTLDERINWFQQENTFVSGRIYYASHQARFHIIQNYIEKRFHYEMVKFNRFQQPPIILLDRGPLSTEAYTYASIRSSSQLPAHYIFSFIDMLKNDFPLFTPDLSICLLPDGDPRTLVERLDIEGAVAAKELQLIKGQIEYIRHKAGAHVQLVDCLQSEETVYTQVNAQIEALMHDVREQNIRSLKGHSLHDGIFFLEQILMDVQHLPFEKDVFLVGGLVQKGYTDNDVDFVVQCEADQQILATFYKGQAEHFHIDLVAPDEVSKVFGGKEAWYLKV